MGISAAFSFILLAAALLLTGAEATRRNQFRLIALLSGAQQVGPKDMGAAGLAVLDITKSRKGFTLVFAITAYNLSGTLPPLFQHIHDNGVGLNGPVVVTFPGMWLPVPGAADTIVLTGHLSNLTALSVLKGVIADPQGYYVNVHTTSYPAGAIRGQLFPEMASIP